MAVPQTMGFLDCAVGLFALLLSIVMKFFQMTLEKKEVNMDKTTDKYIGKTIQTNWVWASILHVLSAIAAAITLKALWPKPQLF